MFSTLKEYKERLVTAVLVALAEAGFVDEDGRYDRNAHADALLPTIAAAVAERTADRAKVGVTRRQMMSVCFPQVAGPESFDEQEDPDWAEAVYKNLDQKCWALVDIEPSGLIQSRLNGDHQLVLCRTKSHPDRADIVYVTHDMKCVTKDVLEPGKDIDAKRATREALRAAMLIERLPEHGKKIEREVLSGMRSAAKAAGLITKAKLDSIEAASGDDA